MRKVTIFGIVMAIGLAPALGQPAGTPPAPGRPAPPAVSRPAPAKPAVVSTPESRSAAILATSTEPTFDEGTYARLKDALLSYSGLQVRGGWPTLPADSKLAPGSTGPVILTLRQRLVITEDLPAGKKQGDTYDDALTEGVKHFQIRHGLEATGSVGPQTLAALNVPVKSRLQQLAASLERLVGMDFKFGQRYVVVNIPAAYTEAIANDKVERRFRVIVGKADKPSPTLTTMITSVNLNPTWTVPLSITKNEIIPKMRKDPGYLERMHMRLLGGNDSEVDPRSIDWSSNRSPNFSVRQDSGTWNALGALKIDMPNPYAVYMHDTNVRNLFTANYRFLSHGCARVDNVRDLAAWILEDTPGWGRARIDAGIAAGQRTDVPLARKIPVAWVYLTSWVTRDGTVQFRDDVYDHDDDPVSPASRGSELIAAAGASGFVRPRETKRITQASNLDSR
jgi:murein L,D-transpeptidase YcbB/YkuD